MPKRIGPYEAPEPADPDVERLIREFVALAGFDVVPSSHGWRLTVPGRLDRKQAVYVGPAGTDAEGRPLLALVSVCGPANDRDLRILLKLNARMTDGHFAIRVLRGEEYFVVIENLPLETAASVDPRHIVRQDRRACRWPRRPPLPRARCLLTSQAGVRSTRLAAKIRHRDRWRSWCLR